MADYYDEHDSYGYDDDIGPASPTMSAHNAATNGLGSLADELAAAWSDEEGDEMDGEDGDVPRSPTTPRSPTHRRHASISSVGSASSQRRRFARLSNDTASSMVSNGTSATSATNASKPMIRHHRRMSSSATVEINGNHDGIPSSLEDKMEQIESEALRGLSMVKAWSRRQRAGILKRRPGINGMVDSEEIEEDDDPICRLLEGLQNLSSQSGIETGTQRLITAHNSLSTHVQNQSRTLRDLSLQLNAPGTTVTTAAPRLSTRPITISSKGAVADDEDEDDDKEDDDDTTPLFANLLSTVPTPTIQPLQDLQNIHQLTVQLISHFAGLSDAIHMFKQQSNAASRKLRGAKEAIREYKLEVETVEQARRWIDEGDWDRRLDNREAAGVCREVLGGFEDVIRNMERRIEGLC
ncbi:hypothetical protein TWF102_010644 [Orbilia oligospora]|uniref:Uncharacterized protein n=1 Tax=Orbilia oligospora TaxID=2813651 RepID=A0A7C8J9J5_ORBOL|nr:hypothetical protein TWF102_010644 [Orbilia oligospora]KAF3100507.1 hypothetical protein TWF103_008229 [Orbilia oligospora]KAF3110951.1 hypothetical protein TWF706_000410 [Orbilia oligospora]KAF3135435.1 hypothetical protein TWF703_005979 [Orbilia oligospora]KAF3139083.1 hypothetical protein TWF594_006834 [Orbilia oligospora]